MAIWVEETRNIPGGKQQVSFGADSMADIPNLPALSDSVSEGSDCFTVKEKKLVMLGSDGVWI